MTEAGFKFAVGFDAAQKCAVVTSLDGNNLDVNFYADDPATALERAYAYTAKPFSAASFDAPINAFLGLDVYGFVGNNREAG